MLLVSTQLASIIAFADAIRHAPLPPHGSPRRGPTLFSLSRPAVAPVRMVEPGFEPQTFEAQGDPAQCAAENRTPLSDSHR
eukprot:1608353-Prymnesium_polylepis.1